VIWLTLPLIGCNAQLINLAMPQAGSREIRPDNDIRQSFVATADDLNRVEVYLQTFFRQNTHTVTLNVVELPPDASPLAEGVLRSQTQVNASTLPPQGWYAAEFEPLPNSAGRRFVLQLESPGSTPGDAITVGGVLAADPYAAGAAFVGDRALDGDIAFRACYPLTVAEKLAFLADELTTGRPGLWGNPAFYLIIGLLYLLLMMALFGLLARSAWPSNPR
jgi:hypothetical protein